MSNIETKTNVTQTFTPRGWQTEGTKVALEAYETKTNVTVVAAPGSGKTLFTLNLFKELKAQGKVDRLLYLVPTDNLRTQTADSAKEVLGLKLSVVKGYYQPLADFDGCVETYASLKDNSEALEAYLKTHRVLLVLDEGHHLGLSEAKTEGWGVEVEKLGEHTTLTLVSSGTPWTSTGAKLPFVEYHLTDKGLVVKPDVLYTLQQGVADGHLREVTFTRFAPATVTLKSGELFDYSDDAEEERKKNHFESKPNKEYRSPRDSQYAWLLKQKPIYTKLVEEGYKAYVDLKDVQAGLLVTCSNKKHLTEVKEWFSKTYPEAGYVVATGDSKFNTYKRPFGEEHALVGGAKEAVKKFKLNDVDFQVLFAVKAVSEGTDVKRLRVLVHLNNHQTATSWVQTVGRVARRQGEKDVSSEVFYLATELTDYLALNYKNEWKLAEVLNETEADQVRPLEETGEGESDEKDS